MIHPLPLGAEVHHRGGVYSLPYDLPWLADKRATDPYWGTVTEVSKQYSDGSYEYVIRRNGLMYKSQPMETQWASYHIDSIYGVVEKKVCP